MLQRCPPRVPNEKIYVMLRIAIQNKGRLNEQSVALLREIGINVDEAKRKFLSKASNFPIEVLYLRDDDIPQVVANGTASLGIVGLNEVAERGFDVEVVARLGFGGCRISLAIPKGDEYAGVEYFRGKRIATSYPSILRRYLEQQGVDAELEVITGSVEIAPAAGIADEVLVELSYAIGIAQPLSIYVDTYRSKRPAALEGMTDGEIARRIGKLFDLRPAAIVKRFGLKNPIFEATASYGHFGNRPYKKVEKLWRDGHETEQEIEFFGWEKLDAVEMIRKEFGL